MKARLNITSEQPLLDQVKKYAAQKNTSVSELVEDYFKVITKPKKQSLVDLLNTLPKPAMDENFINEVGVAFKAIRPYFNYMSEVLTTDLNGESLI